MTHRLRIAVVDADPATRDALERAIPAIGHVAASVAATARELAEHCAAAPPDVIVAGPAALGGLGAVQQLTSPPVVLVGDPAGGDAALARVADLGVAAYLPRPVAPPALAAAIALAHRHAEDVRALRQELATARQELEDRKVIERAKEAAARRLGVTEAEGFARVRKLATSTNRKLIDVAREVLAGDAVFRPLDGPPGHDGPPGRAWPRRKVASAQ